MASSPWQFYLLAPALALLASCAQPLHEVRPVPVKVLERQVNACRTLVMAVTAPDATAMMAQHRLAVSKKREVILGSAAPISADGYFLTANHVVSDATNHDLVLIYNIAGKRAYGRAKLVWRDARADVALLRSTLATPDFYQFSPRSQDLPEGTQILHAGMATGNKAQIGRLGERVSGRGSAGFLHSLRLAPGDSGGPVLLFSGELVGVNSAVGYVTALDTRFFSESKSARPDPQVIEAVIARDREVSRRSTHAPRPNPA